MKIEVGKYYKARDGRKVGPMDYWDYDPEFMVSKSGDFVGFRWYCEGGKIYPNLGCHLDLIAEWEEWTVYNNDLPFGDLTDEQKGALLLAAHEGGEVELYSDSKGEWFVSTPLWIDICPYRIKSPAEPMSFDWSAIKPEYKWAAVDGAGDALAFTSKPEIKKAKLLGCDFSHWSDGKPVFKIDHLSSYKRGTVDWQHSLIERPADV